MTLVNPADKRGSCVILLSFAANLRQSGASWWQRLAFMIWNERWRHSCGDIDRVVM